MQYVTNIQSAPLPMSSTPWHVLLVNRALASKLETQDPARRHRSPLACHEVNAPPGPLYSTLS